MKRPTTLAIALGFFVSLTPAVQADPLAAALPIRPQSLTTEQYNALVAIEQNPENVAIGEIHAGYRDENVQFTTDALSVGFLLSFAGALAIVLITQGLSL